jgi:hypothetical protein
MTLATFQHQLTLETTFCTHCGLPFAMPAEMLKVLRRDGNTFYCPNGHAMSWRGITEADRLRKMLEEANRSKTRLASDCNLAWRMQSEAEEALKKEKAAAKRVNTRIHAGVCPCCNRTFQNLQRHMATKHKEDKEDKT